MSAPPTGSRAGLREQRKARTRRTIQEHALRLFLDQGYDATTVDQIAAAAGVSHMTFFRYFRGKPDVVEQDAYDPVLAELIRSRPAAEPPLVAIHRAVLTALRALPADEVRTVLARARLILGTPALRARQAEQQAGTVDLFVAAIVDRGNGPAAPVAVRAVAAAAVAVLSSAIAEWVSGAGRDDLAELVDTGFRALRPALG